ncbi:MAG: hypothetical protein KC431_08460, partial [Myxococcales bacterium]|nr:hypothetical protein [Myxococcales bacterium]
GDALLHAGGSMLIRDVLLPVESRPLPRALLRGARAARLLPAPASADQSLRADEAGQTRAIRLLIVALALVAWVMLAVAGGTSVVDLLLLAYAIPIQFLPIVILGLYWRRANKAGAEAGLATGLAVISLLFVLGLAAPELAAAINPLKLELGVIGLVFNLAVMITVSLLSAPPDAQLLARFELEES